MANVRVLIVDDEPDFAELLKERLVTRGLQVTTASDGFEALEMLKTRSFDAIVLDLVMPGMDGLETLDKILAADRDAQVILLTGHGTVEKGVEAVRHGAADFLEKPATMEDLLARIGEASAKRTTLLQERSAEKIEEILRRKGW